MSFRSPESVRNRQLVFEAAVREAALNNPPEPLIDDYDLLTDDYSSDEDEDEDEDFTEYYTYRIIVEGFLRNMQLYESQTIHASAAAA